jgi:hypothetical protein
MNGQNAIVVSEGLNIKVVRLLWELANEVGVR